MPDGFKLVPVELTAEMAHAAREMHEGEAFLPYSIYRAMLAAAPEITPIADKRQTITDEMKMGSRLTKHRFSLDNTTNNTETNNNE
ncbi:hypothetical protein D3C79_1067730 [compost metagenome]